MAEVTLPQIPGISARLWRDDEDYGHATDLVNIEMRSIGLDHLATEEEVRNAYDNTPTFDLYKDFVFVEIDGTPVGWVLVRWWDETDGPRVYRHMCKMHPDWRNRGIGTAMLEWAIARLTELAGEHGVANRVLRTDVDNFPATAADLLESFGYRITQRFAELVRPHLEDIPIGPLPDGVEIRPVEEAHLRAIFDAEWDAMRDHWGHYEPTEGDWNWFLEFPHRDESLWKVAWAGDKIVGQVRGYINTEENEETGRKRGWCEFISTDREWRRKGVATALICATLREFNERGMTDSALGVHVENPNMALRLYTGLGFAVESQGATFERALEI